MGVDLVAPKQPCCKAFNDDCRSAMAVKSCNVEKLMKEAEDNHKGFQLVITELAKAMNAQPDKVGLEKFAMKSKQSVMDKINSPSDPTGAGKIADYLRATILFPTVKELCESSGKFDDLLEKASKTVAGKIYDATKHRFSANADKGNIKNSFEKPTPAGYMDIKVYINTPTGMVCELQLNVQAMAGVKNEQHHNYEQSRVLPADDPRKAELEKIQINAYNAVSNAFEPKAFECVKKWKAYNNPISKEIGAAMSGFNNAMNNLVTVMKS